MCGILGILNYQSNDYFAETLQLISHRGPDSSDIYRDEKILLGHTRLSILDLSSNSNQPMVDSSGRYLIVFNGEIYNFNELKKTISSKYLFKTASDTEVLLNLYIERGAEILEELNGIFSFAIWDKFKQELFLARDRFGTKPLFYSIKNNSFYFSSEIKVIKSLLNNEDLDINVLISHLSYIWNSSSQTVFNGIHKLPPGSSMVISNNKFFINKWFKQNYVDKLANNNFKELSRLLKRSVESQMVSDVPVGAFLSGGLDSTSIVYFAKNINPSIECFTIDVSGMEKEGFDNDLNFAKAAAKYLDVNLNIIKIGPKDFIDNIDSIMYYLDEPIADPSAFNSYFISSLAKKNGIKVLLSGIGGDDIFTGYRRHRGIYFDKFLHGLPRGLKKSMDSDFFSSRFKFFFSRRVNKFLSGFSLPPNERLLNYFRWNSKHLVNNLISDHLQINITKELENNLIKYINSMPQGLSQIKKALELERKFFLTEQNLVYADRMSMAHGVEVRVPFLDNHLVDFAVNLPESMLQNLSNDKLIFKLAMENYLPDKFIYRKKTGFGVPLRSWIKNDLRDYVHSELSDSNINRYGIFNSKNVNKLIDDNEKDKFDASYLIFSLLCVQSWLKSNFSFR
jgi:asparagine synthase (glutamine-hydrolysing)